MTIETFRSITNFGIFKNFHWPDGLHTFTKYNLVYGWNGTGKTTLSRILRALEPQERRESEQADLGEATIEIDGKRHNSKDFNNLSVPIRVFNQDFVDDNVFRTPEDTAKPILMLGKEQIQHRKQLNDLNVQLTHQTETLNSHNVELDEQRKKLESIPVKNAKLIKEALTTTASREHANYNRRDYIAQAKNIIASGNTENFRLSDSLREQLLSQHRANQMAEIEIIKGVPTDLRHITDNIVELLRTKISASIIQSLRDDSEIERWVRSGYHLHRNRDEHQCLFCGGDVNEERWESLEAHFNDAYESLITSVQLASQTAQTAKGKLEKIQIPHKNELYEHLQDQYVQVMSEFESQRLQAAAHFASLTQALDAKQGSPFAIIELEHRFASNLLTNAITKMNEIIQQHNDVVANHTNMARNVRLRLERGMVAETLPEYCELTSIVETLARQIKSEEVQQEKTREKIGILEANATQYQIAVEELNVDLAKYYDHGELHLAVEGDGYAVHRNGTRAKKLSEGETTAIALLYFLQSLRDHRFDFSQGIVVLDDPISSLDSSSLYSAFSFIIERTKNVAQLFVFTHNLSFFRLVKRWLRGKIDLREDPADHKARFFMLRCIVEDGIRCSELMELDWLLKRFDSDYEYLFACIYYGTRPNDRRLHTNYLLPNVARRLLETFLAFKFPSSTGNFSDALHRCDNLFDQHKIQRILKFVHSYSHSDAIDDPGHDPVLLAETGPVLEDVLKLMKVVDREHYEGLVKLAQKNR